MEISYIGQFACYKLGDPTRLRVYLRIPVKAQSRAMGNTADTKYRLNPLSAMSKSILKLKRYAEYFNKWRHHFYVQALYRPTHRSR